MWQTMMPAILIPKTEQETQKLVDSIHGLVSKSTKEEVREKINRELKIPLFKNNIYQAALYDDTPEEEKKKYIWMRHLSIKRIDKEPIHDWRDLQRIKNDICGGNSEAVEIYPSEERHVDYANQYHLWVFPPDYKIPFGFKEGGTDYNQRLDGTKQRTKGDD